MILLLRYRYAGDPVFTERTVVLEKAPATAIDIVAAVLDKLADSNGGEPCPFTDAERDGPLRLRLLEYVTANRDRLHTGDAARNVPLEYTAVERPRRTPAARTPAIATDRAPERRPINPPR